MKAGLVVGSLGPSVCPLVRTQELTLVGYFRFLKFLFLIPGVLNVPSIFKLMVPIPLDMSVLFLNQTYAVGTQKIFFKELIL